jgi:diaminopimelate epimerase
MPLHFTKMHGLGNDFMVVDAVNQKVELNAARVRRWGDRHFGIGFDQLLLVEASARAGIDFKYRIFNNDGNEVEQCGNGARCFARFVRDKGLSNKNDLVVETKTRDLRLQIRDDGLVAVDMGAALFAPAEIPIRASERAPTYDINLDGNTVSVACVSVGNPHAVLLVDNVDTAPVLTLGPQLQAHPFFPNRVNVGFLQIIDRQHARLRVFERGAGETLACGTGACAAAVTSMQRDLMDSVVYIQLRGGELEISWTPGAGNITMTGPATTVYEGIISL